MGMFHEFRRRRREVPGGVATEAVDRMRQESNAMGYLRKGDPVWDVDHP